MDTNREIKGCVFFGRVGQMVDQAAARRHQTSWCTSTLYHTPTPCPDRGSGHGRGGLRRGPRVESMGLASLSTVFTVRLWNGAPSHAALQCYRQLCHCNGNPGLPWQQQDGIPKVLEPPGWQGWEGLSLSEIRESNKHEGPVYTSKLRRVKIRFRGWRSRSIPEGKRLAGIAAKLKMLYKKA